MSGPDDTRDDRARRLSEATRAGLRGRDLYWHVFGRPALPPRDVRLARLGEGYRTAVRLSRGCPWTRRGVVAGLTRNAPAAGATP